MFTLDHWSYPCYFCNSGVDAVKIIYTNSVTSASSYAYVTSSSYGSAVQLPRGTPNQKWCYTCGNTKLIPPESITIELETYLEGYLSKKLGDES
jgi:hypothetical protein